MSDRLTAKRAAEIADECDPNKAVDNILARVLAQAKSGKRSLIVKEYGFSTGQCYDVRQNWPQLCRDIQDELQALGYTADVRSVESQFVDLYLEVSW